MPSRIFHTILLLLLNICCRNKTKQPVAAVNTTQENKAAITIVVQPFTGMPDAQVQAVAKEAKKVYPFVEINKPIDLPQTAYYVPRSRYRADSLISFLGRRTPDGFVTLGLTNKDISTTKEGIADWGVMGLGFCPGNACIASTFRLSGQNKTEQLFKVAIHEAGHTQGLPHCPVKTCFMRDAEGKNPTDEEKEFCSACKAHLVKRGWRL